MNENEIRRQLESIENEIRGSYSGLRNAAAMTGDAAEKAMSSHKLLWLLGPLLAGVILFFIFGSTNHPFIAIICVAAGIYIAVKANDSAKQNLNSVRRLRNNMINVLNNMRDINS